MTCDPRPTSPFDHFLEIAAGGAWATANAAFVRDELLDAGGFDERFVHGHEDTELAIRMRRRGPTRFCPEIVVNHPPHRRPVASVLASHRYWTSDLTLFECQPAAFRAGHGGRHPLAVVLWNRGVRLALTEIASRRRFLTSRPTEFLAYVAALAVSRIRLGLELPAIGAAYRRARRSGAR